MVGPHHQQLLKASAAFHRGAYNEALSLCEGILAAQPDEPESLHLKALSLGRLGRIDEAIAAFEKAATRHPARHAVLGNLANLLKKNDLLNEASAAYTKTIEANPNFADGYLGLANTLRLLDEPTRAEKTLRDGLAAQPKDARLLNNLGVLLESIGRSEEAIGYFGEALAQRPDMISALVNRGAALRNITRFDAALKDLTKAVALAPNLAEAHYQLANVLRQSGDRPGAEAAYQKAIECDPTRKDVHEDYAKMLWEFGEAGRFLTVLDNAIAAHPTPDLYILRSDLCSRAGDFHGAGAAARAALKIDPQSVDALRMEARSFRALNRIKDAIRSAQAALKIAPADFDARHDLAELLLADSQYDEAARLLEGDCPDEHAQQHVGLKALALRASGDEAYRRYYDYDRFTAQLTIETPPGFESLEAFNDTLCEALKPLHPTQTQPIDQTLYGGTQSLGSLWSLPLPIIQTLREALLAAALKFVAQLPEDPNHPFLRQKTQNVRCAGSWSVMLSSGGGHVDHVHPNGWLSGCYYVRVPEEVRATENEKAGFLRLGASGVIGLDLPAERWLRPVEGTVILFPSYMWHGVERFSAASQRVTAPFDLAPAFRR